MRADVFECVKKHVNRKQAVKLKKHTNYNMHILWVAFQSGILPRIMDDSDLELTDDLVLIWVRVARACED